MAGIEHKDFTKPDEQRTPEKVVIDLVNIAGGQVGRYTFEPGWRWSENIKPVVKTDSCQTHHVGYVISGGLHVEHTDGSKSDITAGDVYDIAPGHDAWNTGSEPCVVVEFQGAATYAKA